MPDRKHTPLDTAIDPDLYREVAQFGARDMDICMQCGTCSASCPLSKGADTFPRKIYRYLQLGLRDKLLQSPEPWLCYYCGECNLDCPRGAEPAETMMATRRWLTAQYDWTGLARKLYLSATWEYGALGAVALFVILLFVFFHGPVITDRVAVNTFAPVMWIEIGDLAMAAVLTIFLLSNALRMFRHVMAGAHVPLHLYATQAKEFLIHFATQKRWRECGADRNRWRKHFLLVTGYMTMMTLIIVFIRWFQVDDSRWHFTSLFGYYATGVILYITVETFRSRRRKTEAIHRFSEPSDWLFLVLLFLTTLTGIVMHAVRLAGWPLPTYILYVIHLAIAVPMLVVEVPFGKWSHLLYRPLAAFLTTVREKAVQPSRIDITDLRTRIGDTFMSCLQCGVCTAVCPWNQAGGGFSPRKTLRHMALATGTTDSIDEAVWNCTTCGACGDPCPRGISIDEPIRSAREILSHQQNLPAALLKPLQHLKTAGNPWGGDPERRTGWAGDLELPDFSPEQTYCLFTCCTTAYADSPSARIQEAGQALPRLLNQAGTSFGSFGTREVCCGDPALQLGDAGVFTALSESNQTLFQKHRVNKILTTSPHCLHTFTTAYANQADSLDIEHYTVLLDRLITDGALVPQYQIETTVTFHDPCYLGRHHGVYDAPRRILSSIPGLSLVEMRDTREQSLCCGGGGGCAFMPNGPAARLAGLRIQQALDANADVIVTACPYCMRMLQQAAEARSDAGSVRVRDIAELLLQSIVKTDGRPLPIHINLELDQEVLHA